MPAMRDASGKFIKGHPGIPNSGMFKKGCKKLEHAYSWGKKEKHYNWKGGRTVSRGRVFIYKPDHPYCDHHGYVMEHRLVMEEKIGRVLLPSEKVHHLNKKTTDNRIVNLMLVANQSEHIRVYHKKPRDHRNRFLKES